MHALTTLQHLTVCGCPCIETFPEEDFTIPPNLVHLQIQNLPKLKSISEGLLDLISLEALDVRNCDNLQCLPEKGLPITLGVLQIRKCPLLEEECRNEKDG
ncbi:hypothetical protein V6Z11_A08G166800 [Gossypium hirsutum]